MQTTTQLSHVAALNDHAEAIDVLVEAGADIEAQDSSESYTPLHCASEKLNCRALHSLLKHGANGNAQDNDSLETPLILAAAYYAAV